MINKYLSVKIAAILIIIMILVTGCSAAGNSNTASSDTATSDTTAISANQTITGSSSVVAKVDDDTGSQEWNNAGTITLGSNITYTGTGVSVNGSKVSITAGGDFTVTGTLTDGMISIDTSEKVKLRLSGVNITNSNGPAIYFVNAKKAFITLTEGTANYLTDGSKYTVDAKAALFSNDTLEIKGSGTLNVKGNYKHGIASDDDILIESGTIVLKSAIDGLHANNNITVYGGNITLDSASDAIDSEGDIIINDGTFSITAGDDGIHTDTELTLNGGKIEIANSYEGLESKTVLTVNGGKIRITASDDALNANSNIVINNGTIFVDCNGDGFDSNGNMTINGGTTVLYSGNNANGPLDTGENTSTFTINGGTVIAAGGNMGINVSEDSRQYSIWINSSLAANALVNIAAENGTEIAAFAPIKSCSLIFYSSDRLKSNAVYNISTGGSYNGKSVDGIYGDGSYTAGTLLGTATMSAKSASVGQSTGMGRGFGGGMGGHGGGKGVPGGDMGGPGNSKGAPQGN